MNILGLAAIGLTSELQRSRIGGFNPGYVTDNSCATGQGGPVSPAPKLVPASSRSRPHSAKGHTSVDSSRALESNQTEVDISSTLPQVSIFLVIISYLAEHLGTGFNL